MAEFEPAKLAPVGPVRELVCLRPVHWACLEEKCAECQLRLLADQVRMLGAQV